MKYSNFLLLLFMFLMHHAVSAEGVSLLVDTPSGTENAYNLYLPNPMLSGIQEAVDMSQTVASDDAVNTSEECCRRACLWGWMACEEGANYDNKVHLKLADPACLTYVSSICWTIQNGTFYGANGAPVSALCPGMNNALWFEPVNPNYPVVITATINFGNGWESLTVTQNFVCGQEVEACVFEPCSSGGGGGTGTPPDANCCNDACLLGWMACENEANYDNKVFFRLENQECGNYLQNTKWTIQNGTFYGPNGAPVTMLDNGLHNHLWFEPTNPSFPVKITVTLTFNNGWAPITITHDFVCGDDVQDCTFEPCTTTVIQADCCNDACLMGWMACEPEANYDNKVFFRLEHPECNNYIQSTCWTIQNGYFYGAGGQPTFTLCNGMYNNLWFEPLNPNFPVKISVTINFNNGWAPVSVTRIFQCGDDVQNCVFPDCGLTNPDPGSGDRAVSLFDSEKNNVLTVFPNPVYDNQFEVAVPGLSIQQHEPAPAQISVLDLVSGQLLHRVTIDASQIADGRTYMLKIPASIGSRNVLLQVQVQDQVFNKILTILNK